MSDLPGHIVKSYEAELRRLRDLLVEMGGLVEAQVAAATTAVLEFDLDAATRTVEQDPAVDALEREVEQFVLRLLALRQPVAQDLRAIIAALKVSSDFERIGDYAANVAKRSIVLSQFSLPFKLSGLAHMTRLVQENLKLVVDAVGDGDADKAAQVWRGDEAVDDIYTAIFRELVTYMMEDVRSITPCTHLLFIAKNMERIGDHATNIAEIIHFATTGESLPEQRPKGESPNYAVIRHRAP
jgi:phosphate transport system protein